MKKTRGKVVKKEGFFFKEFIIKWKFERKSEGGEKVSGREIALRCEEKITEAEMKIRVNDRKMGKIHEK